MNCDVKLHKINSISLTCHSVVRAWGVFYAIHWSKGKKTTWTDFRVITDSFNKPHLNLWVI